MSIIKNEKTESTVTKAVLGIAVVLFFLQFAMNRWLASAKDPTANKTAADAIIQFKDTRLSDLSFDYRSSNPNWSSAGIVSKSLGLRASVYKVPNMQANSSIENLPVGLKNSLGWKVRTTEHRNIGGQPVEVRDAFDSENEDLNSM